MFIIRSPYFVKTCYLVHVALKQWFPTWSRCTTGGPPGISSDPQWIPGLRLNKPLSSWPLWNTVSTSCSWDVRIANWPIGYFFKKYGPWAKKVENHCTIPMAQLCSKLLASEKPSFPCFSFLTSTDKEATYTLGKQLTCCSIIDSLESSSTTSLIRLNCFLKNVRSTVANRCYDGCLFFSFAKIIHSFNSTFLLSSRTPIKWY